MMTFRSFDKGSVAVNSPTSGISRRGECIEQSQHRAAPRAPLLDRGICPLPRIGAQTSEPAGREFAGKFELRAQIDPSVATIWNRRSADVEANPISVVGKNGRISACSNE